MVTDELLKFIRIQYDAGMKTDDIAAVLLEHGGWERPDVEEGFASLKIPFVSKIKPPEVLPTTPAVSPLVDTPIVEEKVSPPTLEENTPKEEPAVLPVEEKPFSPPVPVMQQEPVVTSAPVSAAPPPEILDVSINENFEPLHQEKPQVASPAEVEPSNKVIGPSSGNVTAVSESEPRMSDSEWNKEILGGGAVVAASPHVAPVSMAEMTASPVGVPETKAGSLLNNKSNEPVVAEKKGFIDDFLGLFGEQPESKQTEPVSDIRTEISVAPKSEEPEVVSSGGVNPPAVSSIIEGSAEVQQATPAVSLEEKMGITAPAASATTDSLPEATVTPIVVTVAPATEPTNTIVATVVPSENVAATAVVKPDEQAKKIDKDEELFGPISFSISSALTGEKATPRDEEVKTPEPTPSTTPESKTAPKSDWSLQKFLTERSNPSYVKEITPPVPTTASPTQPPAVVSPATTPAPAAQPTPKTFPAMVEDSPTSAIDATKGEIPASIPPINLHLDAIVQTPPQGTMHADESISVSVQGSMPAPASLVTQTAEINAATSVHEKLAERGIRMFKRTMASDLLMQKEHKDIAPAVTTPERVSQPVPSVMTPASRPEQAPASDVRAAQVAPVREAAPQQAEAPRGVAPENSTEPPMTVKMNSIILKDKQGEPQKEKTPAEPHAQPFAFDEGRKRSVKRVMRIAILGLAVLVLLVLGFLAWRIMRPSEPGVLFSDAAAAFLAAPAFSYHANLKADLMMSPAVPMAETPSGVIRFDLSSDGVLANTPTGLGDGTHDFHLRGGIGAGDMATTSDVTSEIRVIGDKVYFHITDVPAGASIPKDLLSQYWVEVDMGEIAKELSLGGLAISGANYGAIIASDEQSIIELIKKYPPFTPGAVLEPETIDGVPALHFALVPNKENFLQLTIELYRKFMNKELVMSEEDRTRMKDAFQKITGELWVDKKSHAPLKFAFSANMDDQLFGVRLKGTLASAMLVTIKSSAAPVAAPETSITTADLGARLIDYQRTEELRRNDDARIDKLHAIVAALQAYSAAKKRFPTVLSELHTAKLLATTTVSAEDLKTISYAPYVSDKNLTRAGRCGYQSKVCAYYHVGIGLELLANPKLADDVDRTSDVKGADLAGCQNEPARACYDLVSPPPVTTETTVN